MKKSLLFLLISAVLVSVIVAGSLTLAATKKTIGFSVYDMQYGFFQQMEKGTKDGIVKLGYNYILHDQKSDETQMISGCQDLITQGVAALVISPNKPEALPPIVNAAHQAGIPVVVDDIGGGGSDYDALIVSDNFAGGKLAGDYALKMLKGVKGAKTAAIIKCEPSAVFAIRRGEGFKSVMVKAGYKIVSELSGHSRPEEGYRIMKDIITANPDVQVVFCENDPMGAAAAQAAVDAGRKDIMVIGFNADEIALKAIQQGTMAATVQQFPYKMGVLSAQIANKLIRKQKVKFDNAKDREIYAEVKLITKANVDAALAEIK